MFVGSLNLTKIILTFWVKFNLGGRLGNNLGIILFDDITYLGLHLPFEIFELGQTLRLCWRWWLWSPNWLWWRRWNPYNPFFLFLDISHLGWSHISLIGRWSRDIQIDDRAECHVSSFNWRSLRSMISCLISKWRVIQRVSGHSNDPFLLYKWVTFGFGASVPFGNPWSLLLLSSWCDILV